jgi:hypothetical protein
MTKAKANPAPPQKLTPDMLVDRLRVFNVDDLRLMEANPNQGDVGAVHASMEEFGQVNTILVVDGVVVDGNHRVVAERQARRFDGKLAGIDATGLDLSDVRAMAMGLALNRTARLGHDDLQLLSDALLKIQGEDEALLTAAGWSLEDLDDLLRDIDHPQAGGAGDDLGDYSRKIEAPIYEPTGEQPPVGELYDPTRAVELRAEIDAADVPGDGRAFLHAAADRHTRFRFDRIADYYAHAPAPIQDLMERSALVIIDLDQAIELGYAKLTGSLLDQYTVDYPDGDPEDEP